MNKFEARKRIWTALATTLENDLDGVGAEYIYERDPETDEPEPKLEAAAREILLFLLKKAGDK